MTRPLPPAQWIRPQWPAAGHVRALITTRAGGVSGGSFGAGFAGGGMNIGLSSGDEVAAVRANRARLREFLPAEPRWLSQVHGSGVHDADQDGAFPVADAAVSAGAQRVCVVSIADCLPVFFTDPQGRVVGAAHAGWRGLAAGVLQNTAAALRVKLGEAGAELLAYLGPAIGPTAFEVGGEVLAAMRARLPRAEAAFVSRPGGKYLADLFALARQALGQAGIERVFGGGQCTYSDPGRFYSFRRDRITGRHAALIWIERVSRADGMSPV